MGTVALSQKSLLREAAIEGLGERETERSDEGPATVPLGRLDDAPCDHAVPVE